MYILYGEDVVVCSIMLWTIHSHILMHCRSEYNQTHTHTHIIIYNYTMYTLYFLH